MLVMPSSPQAEYSGTALGDTCGAPFLPLAPLPSPPPAWGGEGSGARGTGEGTMGCREGVSGAEAQERVPYWGHDQRVRVGGPEKEVVGGWGRWVHHLTEPP